jgi:hypothetical protein
MGAFRAGDSLRLRAGREPRWRRDREGPEAVVKSDRALLVAALRFDRHGSTPAARDHLALCAQKDWNVCGLEWTRNDYKFWMNGQLSWTFTTAIFHRNDERIRLTQETESGPTRTCAL